MANPQRIPETGAAAATQIRAIVKQLSDTKKALSPIWTARSLSRRLETLRVPLEDVRLASKALGGSINTAFITAAAEAAGRYHRASGAPIEEMRASMAISTRTKDTKEANAFTLARMLVPTGEIGIGERFKHIQEATDAARASVGSGEPERACGRHCRAPDLAARAHRAAADRDDRLQHVERAGLTRAAVPRRREGRRELPDRADGRHRVQPHAAVVRRKPRHGPQHRRRRGRASGAAAEPHGGVVRRAACRGSTARETKSATKKKPTKKVS